MPSESSSPRTDDPAPNSTEAATKEVPLGFGATTASIGDHIAHFYRGEDQRYSVLGPYVETGLRRGDRCVVISSPEVAEGLCEHLAERDLDVQRAVDTDRLILHSGRATEEEMVQLASDVDTAAESEGRPFVRWSGDGDWALAGDISVEGMLRWEAFYDRFSEEWDMFALCQFDLRTFPSEALMSILRSHPYCVMGEVVVPNLFHDPPAEVLAEIAESERLPEMEDLGEAA